LSSPNKKYILSLDYNGYEMTSSLYIGIVNNFKTEPYIYTSFANWSPAWDESDYFWTDGNGIFLKAVHAKAILNKDSSPNTRYQYICIRVL
jgi:hypothetical protein